LIFIIGTSTIELRSIIFMPETLPRDAVIGEQPEVQAQEPTTAGGPDGRVKPASRFFRGKGEQSVPEPTFSTGIIEADVIRGGGKHEVEFSTGNREAMARHLRDRLIITEKLAEDERVKLSVVDRLLAEKGRSFVDKIDGNSELTRDELALAWVVMHDELVQKASVAKLSVEHQPAKFQRLKDAPVVGRIFSRYATEDTTRVVASDKPRFTSDYLREHGFSDWPAERVEKDLIELNNLRVDLEKRLGFAGSNAEGWSVPDFDRKNGQAMHDHAVKAVGEILAREHGGRSLVELSHEDPVAAARVRHQGMQEGLMILSPELAKSILKAENPEVDTNLIERQIAMLGKVGKKPDEERIAEVEEEIEIAAQELEEAEAKLRSFPEDLKRAEEADIVAGRNKNKADKNLERRRGRIEGSITDLQSQYDKLSSALTLPISTSSSTILAVESSTDGIKAHQEGIRSEMTRILGEIKPLREQLDELIIAQIDAEEAKDESEQALDGLGTLDEARQEVRDKREAKKNVEAALEKLSNSEAVDNEDQVEALRRWGATAKPDAYGEVIDRRFSQKRESEFGRDKLANVTIKNGEITGAELLRKHIFAVTTEGKAWFAKPENQELARKMLSDEAIARGIIETFRIDATGGEIEVAGATYTYEGLLTQIEPRRAKAENAYNQLQAERAKAVPDPAEVARLEKSLKRSTTDLKKYEQPLLTSLLPGLENATQFQVGDTLRFLINEGVKSAANGEPFLKVPDYYLKQSAELDLRTKSIIEEDMGKVNLEMGETMRPRVTWEGPVRTVNGRMFGSPLNISDTEFNFRVTEEFDRGQVAARVEVEVNEEFLKQLPLRVNAAMPEEIRRYFYDASGDVRTEIRRPTERTLQALRVVRDINIPAWITVSDPALNAGRGQSDRFEERSSAAMLDRLRDIYSPEISQKLSVETANRVLELRPEERLRVIKGFENMEITFNMIGVGPTDIRVRFDNEGNFWIANPDGSDENQLEEFYSRREAQYRGDRQTLTADERFDLQTELATIQQYIGMGILENQEYK
jgi:hypothetical protein